jgi:hypothetical protein
MSKAHFDSPTSLLTSEPSIDEESVDDSIEGLSLLILDADDVTRIDQALSRAGPSGQVHLIVEQGKLQGIRTVYREAAIDSPKPPRRTRAEQ